MQKVVYFAPVFSQHHVNIVKSAYPDEQIFFISSRDIPLDSTNQVFLADDFISSGEIGLLAQHFREWLSIVDNECSSKGLFSNYANLLFESFVLPLHQYVLTFRTLCNKPQFKDLSLQLLFVDYSWLLIDCSSTTFGGFGEGALKLESFELLVIPYLKQVSNYLKIPIVYCSPQKNISRTILFRIKLKSLPTVKILTIYLLRSTRYLYDLLFATFSRIFLFKLRYHKFLSDCISSVDDCSEVIFSRALSSTSEFLEFSNQSTINSVLFQSLSTTDVFSFIFNWAKFKSLFFDLTQGTNFVPLLIRSKGPYQRVSIPKKTTKFIYNNLTLDLTQALHEIAISINLDSRFYANSVFFAIKQIISITGTSPKYISYSELKSPHAYILFSVAKNFGCQTRIYQQFKYFDQPLPYHFPCDQFVVSPYLLNHNFSHSLGTQTSLLYSQVLSTYDSCNNYNHIDHIIFVLPPFESENLCEKIIDRISKYFHSCQAVITLCPHPRSPITKKMRNLGLSIKPFPETIASCNAASTLVISYNSGATKYIFSRKIRFLLYLLCVQDWNELTSFSKLYPYLFYSSFDSLFPYATPKWISDISCQHLISDQCKMFYKEFAK